MADRQIRRLAVVDDGRLVGMVSLGDVAVKSDDDDLSGDTLEDVSKGVRQGNVGRSGKQASGRASRNRDVDDDRRRMTDEQAAAAAQPFEAETQDLMGAQSGADKSVKRAGNQRITAKQAKQDPSKSMPQGLKSDSSARKQGIANRSAREENERNDKVIPFRRENEIRNTRIQKPSRTPDGPNKKNVS
jgi:hypothetical protein